MKNNDSVRQQLQAEYDREEELVHTLLQRGADLEKVTNEKKSNAKERNRLKQRYTSLHKRRLWAFTWLERKVLSVMRASKERLQSFLLRTDHKALLDENKRLSEESAQLEKEIASLRQQLRTEKKQASSTIVDWQNLDQEQLENSLQKIKEDGHMLDYLQDLIMKRNIHDKNYRSALKYSALLYGNDQVAAKHKIYQTLLDGLKIEEVPEVLIRSKSDQKDDTVPLQKIASFSASLTLQAGIRQLEAFRPEWELDDKTMAYTFIDELGVRRPWVAEEQFSYTTIPKKEGIVIKPVYGAGSRGVYIVFAFNRIQDVKRSRILNSWDAFQASMQEDITSGRVLDDQWLAEELLYENNETQTPARDIKFYCFYGKVGLILEIRRYPKVEYCWWTADGERVHTGKYEGKLFEGDGVSPEQVDLAASISSEIPAPFIRIDFLKTEEGLVFGEFAAKPGNYDEFDQHTDRRLGNEFLEAQGRLLTDLLKRKSFGHFKASLEDAGRGKPLNV
ncbi:teichuronopeptide biosynthesis [Salicibibacter halophilus]|uniref:Teichuronopeptide biosynthesis n=1 Tax=Salicibibacter halophilus TaxID=2502791 RepID=A0A514LID7_9BACI|nr:ATP-grasp fold amidoligase family protein [Salicibibacter halophilus]QDI91612.1 teichuronopeptide biosynthesis [Salicibibacter halophilus]